MKKILYAFPLVFLLMLVAVFQSGCKGTEDPVTPPVDENIDKESVSARNLLTIGKVIAQANSTIWLYVNEVSPPSSCPGYGVGVGAFTMYYGSPPGCVGTDGVRRSGNMLMPFYVSPAEDSIYTPLSFTQYRIYKNLTDSTHIKFLGSVNFSSKKTTGTSYNFHANGEVLYLTDSGDTKTITLNSVHGTANLNSASTSDDDEYLLYGTLTIQDGELNVTYTITINQSSPLKIVNSCGYPLSGVAGFSSTNSSASCDFSPNGSACDAVAKITKGSFSATIDLSSINF